MFGQSGLPFSATVPYAPLVLVLLVMVAVCCWLVSNRRFWALVDAASSPAVASETSGSSQPRSREDCGALPDGRTAGMSVAAIGLQESFELSAPC